MKATDEELGHLLRIERRLLIPSYQRDYEWTEADQWQLLMDDVLEVTSRLRHARRAAWSKGEPPESGDAHVGPHFMGSVVLEGLPQRGAQVATASVIDGQQRMTTIFLLCRALIDVLLQHNMHLRAKQVRKWILINKDDVQEPDETFKLWPRRRDQDIWRDAMGDELPEVDHDYVQARTYFYDRLLGAVETLDADEITDYLEAVVDALAAKIKLVVVDLDSTDDPQLIFEVLNGRQTPLSASDLVKNLLFMRAGRSEEQVDQLYDRYWQPFDDNWWTGTVGRGHAARGRRDQLLATWLTIQTNDEVNLGRLYGEARDYLASTDSALTDILAGIYELAREYRSIYDHTDDDPRAIADVYWRLERLGVTTAVPLLAWLRTLPPSRLTREQHERITQAVDSFVMRRLVTGGQTRGYGRAFLEVLQAGQNAPDSARIDEVILRALLSAPHGYAWPTDEEFTHHLIHRSLYGSVRQEVIRMMLGPIDIFLQAARSKSERATFRYDDLTIEHVMPREWRDHWPLPPVPEELRSAAAAKRDRELHRLGNLTLISGNLNSSVSNGAWRIKKRGLLDHSRLALNDYFSNLAEWDESSIEERGSELASAACRVWPRPVIEGLDDKPSPTKAMVDIGYLVRVGELSVGEVLVSGSEAFPNAKATVAVDGLLVDGVLYDTPSGAARAATGQEKNGWAFWRKGHSKGPRLSRLRRSLLAGELGIDEEW